MPTISKCVMAHLIFTRLVSVQRCGLAVLFDEFEGAAET